MIASSRRRLGAAGVAGALAAISMGAIGVANAAAPTPPFWTCSAHAATVNIGGSSGFTLDPLHANATPGAPCADDGVTAPLAAAKDPLGTNSATVSSGNAQAQTGLTNGGGPGGNPPPSPTGFQAPAAVAQISNTDLAIGGQAQGGAQSGTTTKPGLEVTAKAIRSYVSGYCNGTTPNLESGNPAYPSGTFADGSPVGGEVADLRINGQSIFGNGQPDQALTQIFQGLSPLAPLVKVSINQVYNGVDPATGDTYITREAVRIELLTAPNAKPLITIVLGSATADYKGAVCANNTNPPGTVVIPPTFGPGSNEPGSPGGGVFSGGQTVVLGSNNSNRPNNGTNASNCVRMRLWFDPERNGRPNYRGGPTSLTTRHGIRRVVRGVIHNCKGQAIVGAKISLVNIVGGHGHLQKTGMRTRPGGKMTMILPNNLTTRTLRYEYRPILNRATVASGGRKDLRLRVTR